MARFRERKWFRRITAASLLFGISRAWELVGLRDVGLFRSLSTLRHPDAASTVGPEIGPDDTAGSGL